MKVIKENEFHLIAGGDGQPLGLSCEDIEKLYVEEANETLDQLHSKKIDQKLADILLATEAVIKNASLKVGNCPA